MNEKLTKERRVKPRLLCAELIGVIWIDKSTEERRRIANLDDISTNGACIQVDQFIEVGTPMTLQYSGGEFTGAVRYCCYRDGNYFVGVEFDEGSEWSRKDFHPKHLFDPRRIVPQSLRRPSKYIH
jgi:PilZ domain